MSCFSKILSANSEYRNIRISIEKHRLPLGVLGLSHIHKANIIEALCGDLHRKAVVITPDEAQAARLVRPDRYWG